MPPHLAVVAKSLDEFLVIALLAKQVAAGTFMLPFLLHGDNRVEENGEIGPHAPFGMGGERGREVSAGREPHDTNVVRVEPPLRRTVAQNAHGLLGIAEWHVMVALWHAVLQHGEGGTLLAEKFRPVGALVLHGKMRVASSGAVEHRPSRCFRPFGKENVKFGGVRRVRDVDDKLPPHALCAR